MRTLFIYLCLLLHFSISAQEPAVEQLPTTEQIQAQRIRQLEDSLLVEKTRKEVLATQKSKSEKQETKTDILNELENPEETAKTVTDNVGKTVNNVRSIISPSKILTVLLVLLLTWLMVKATEWFFNQLVDRFQRKRLQILRIKPIIAISIWILSLVALVKTIFNPSTETLIAAAGGSGLGLAFALQDVLKNIFGGFLILLNRPFQVGDRVSVKDSYGEVMKIGLQTTTINTLDDSLVTIPNSAIASDNVTNANSGALDCMVVVDLWLPINIPVEKVRSIAFEAAITSRYLNIDKPVTVLFFDHFDQQAATNVKVKAYVLDARYEKPFAGDVTEAAKKAFAQNGIYV